MDTRISRLLSYVLRHRPDEVGVSLDSEGWTEVEVLLASLRAGKGVDLDEAGLRRIVAEDEKGRYALRKRDGKLYVRANQGHSVASVDAVDEMPRTPPDLLFHGTTRERWAEIRASGGLRRMRRHHVHLSADRATAWSVGARHRRETPLLLEVDAGVMAGDGFLFRVSANGVWMADEVPLRYLREGSWRPH
jgi:putative RNA 2'-phosphotransferase